MLAKYQAVSYELLRPGEVKQIRDRQAIVDIVGGSLEWHSFHLPLGTDGLKAHAVCCEAALVHGGVVLPPFYLGLHGDENWGPEGWENYTLGYHQREMFEAAMDCLVRALVVAGWRVIVGVTGHDVVEQRDAMRAAIECGTDGVRNTGFALMEGDPHAEPTDDIPLRMDHAGAWETSCMQYAEADRVDMDELHGRTLSADERFDHTGPEGIGGKSPVKYASAGLGQRIIERMGDMIGRRSFDLLQRLE